MDSPRAAVVLVGQNPTPALLSSLTLRADHLALVASDGTRPLARRVAAAVERLARPESVSVVSVGPDPHDFGPVTDTLAALHRANGGQPWYLDYTGGTKVMSVAAALLHERVLPTDRHPGSRRWRHYLDAVNDRLRTADGSHPGRPLVSDGVDLRTLAAIHGAHWLEDRDPEPVRLFVQGGRQALQARFPDLSPAVRRGVVAEGRVLSHLLRHTRRRSDTEVVGARQVADPRHPGGSVADFDAVLRHRHRVLCVEAKTRPEDVVARAGWTVAKARRVFGTAVQVLFVHSGPAVPGLRERVTAYNPALAARSVHVWSLEDLLSRLTSFEDIRGAFFPGLASSDTDAAPRPVRASDPDRGTGPTPGAGPNRAPGPGRRPAPPEAPGPPPPGSHPGPKDGPVLVTSLGGSRLGTLTAVHAHRPARTLVLPSRQSVRDRMRDSAARTLHAVEHPGAPPADAALLREAGYRDRVRFTSDPVDGSDADAVAAVAQDWIVREQRADPPPPVVADITTGTKAMSLGLALAARRTGACAAYQLARRRTVVCLTHGELPLRGRASVDWHLVLPGYTPLPGAEDGDGSLTGNACRAARTQVDTVLLDAARAALVRAASGPVRVWMDASLTDPEECLTAQERPSLVLTFDDRAVGLTAPGWLRRRGPGGQAREVGRGAWAQSVFAATAHLGTRCDVAGTVVALTRPGGDVSRAVELVDWITHADPSPHGGPGRIAFGDPLRPLVAVASPDALPALLDTDVSLL
ncbi:CRISPR-associated protein [Nocardiopsis sp. HUAS JQ3]|uniref:CRISPR-associated protein n=1 Tax=Nocardiopsis sp. HUAS JQ3 TaxID=3061629 RepID=UPI0023A9A0B5|nr:CRISPR-associated protein [Nocardiopsis sp. HUAS JQ3]WDZ89152.1 CRISPR-associated protein [Nocardiopsis sp. HUAS JQ3]